MGPNAGSPTPLGLSPIGPGSWNFAIYSSYGKNLVLGLFRPGALEPERLEAMHNTGDVWHAALHNIPDDAEFAVQCDGVHWLIDPYAKVLASSPTWNVPHPYPLRAGVCLPPPFDWENDKRPNLPKEELIIYEAHVRGFTMDPSSKSLTPGTYLGFIEKIPYLKKLGVNAVELMPIFEFDERRKKPLPNYWGYDPLSWFCPKRSFAWGKDAISEFKTLVKELHRNGIEVLLDVVYNHTGEEGDLVLSWRGIDPGVYYLLDEQGASRNYTGCGNTVNANHPVTQALILDSLRYWVEEFHVDGFRFDLASIFTRGENGHVLENPPILQAMKADLVLSEVRLIAEAWDAAGLYQLNFFPRFGPWSEWNGAYRDIVRRFLKGTNGKAGRFANALSGSDVIYASTHTPTSSINFITAHDGFSLRDLTTYQDKHNEANGEMNRDGANQNDNWNCGAEGSTSDPIINALRERQMRNFLLALLLAQGIPMIVMGDEYGHTRGGNNNPYVQDNEINWFLWDQLEKNQSVFTFVRSLIAFRKAHAELRQGRFLTPKDLHWHGTQPDQPNWGAESRFVAWSTRASPRLYVAFNAHYEPVTVTLPAGKWRLVVNTEDGWDKQWFGGGGVKIEGTVSMAPYAALVAREE